MMQVFWIFAALLLKCYAQDVLVTVKDGKVRGTTLSTPSGQDVYAWRHIPFAKPPLGKLRFQPPVRPDPWTGVLDGTKDSKSCLVLANFNGDPLPAAGHGEDCLYVNVYSPVKPNSNVSLPVMFNIFGGGYVGGSSDFGFFDPTSLVLEGVVAVSFNYRLSVFGFLSTEDEVLPGNGALKDQLAALHWTIENIAQFGGNPSDITIFGESAGAFSVGYHLVSPLSRNLFTAAIMQSGASVVNFFQDQARDNAVALAKLVDPSIKDSSSSAEVLDVLQSADADVLLKLTGEMGFNFKPVLEAEGPEAFLTQPILELIEAGNFTRVPIIIGVNSEESLGFMDDLEDAKKTAASYDVDSTPMLPAMRLKSGVARRTVTDEIRREYVGNGNFSDNFGAYVRWMSDNMFIRPAIKHAILQSKYTDVFFYKFSYVGSRSATRPIIPGCGRVGHADEVGYLFNISTKPLETRKDWQIRSKFDKLWTNFAIKKNPTPDNDDSDRVLQDLKWEAFDADDKPYLEIGEDLVVKHGFEARQTTFWDYIWNKYATRPYNTF